MPLPQANNKNILLPMIDSLLSIVPICLALLIGMLAGKHLPTKISYPIARMIGPFVWVLLFVIGFKFGLVLEKLHNITEILFLATTFSVGLSICVAISVYFGLNLKSKPAQQAVQHDLGIAHVLLECSYAFGSIIVGGLVAQGLLYMGWNTGFMPSIDVFLYILLFVIGVDIVNAPVNLKLLNKRTLIGLPLLIMLGSTIGGALIAWLLGIDLRLGLVFSGGYGWFSLTGVMVTHRLGEFYGAIALLNELFRELFSILIIFFVGRRYPEIGIATAGATAMDTTLPIIKRASGNTYIAQAIYIGAILSLIVPFWLAFLLSLL